MRNAWGNTPTEGIMRCRFAVASIG